MPKRMIMPVLARGPLAEHILTPLLAPGLPDSWKVRAQKVHYWPFQQHPFPPKNHRLSDPPAETARDACTRTPITVRTPKTHLQIPRRGLKNWVMWCNQRTLSMDCVIRWPRFKPCDLEQFQFFVSTFLCMPKGAKNGSWTAQGCCGNPKRPGRENTLEQDLKQLSA